MANIKDIAALAGVSIATVSRALSKPDVVKPETIDKINLAIKELNYTPNALASSLRKRRSENIVVAMPSIFNQFASAFLHGIENVAREEGYKLLLGITGDAQALLDRYVGMIAGKQADGVIVLNHLIPTVVREPGPPGVMPPIVLACEYPPSMTLPRVRFDNLEAAALMASHIARLGHRRIALIGGTPHERIAQDRHRGFLLGLKRAGLGVEEGLVRNGDFTLPSGHACARALIATGLPFTALMCANDEMALGAMAALREAGLSVPGDVSVTGIDDLRFGAFAAPPLTTIDLPAVEVGEVSMRLMLDLLRDPADAQREIVIPHRLIERQSSAPPRA